MSDSRSAEQDQAPSGFYCAGCGKPIRRGKRFCRPGCSLRLMLYKQVGANALDLCDPDIGWRNTGR